MPASQPSRARRLSAQWVLPVARPPIEQGAILIDDNGRLAAVGADAEVLRPEGVVAEHFSRSVLLPGLINVHTHLELTGLQGRNDQPAFADWIRRIIALKAERSPAEFLAAARQGVRECFAAGVTTVADTGDSGSVVQALDELGGRGIAYLEVFGPDPAGVEAHLAAFQARVASLRPFESTRVHLGVSPHAPYSVSPALYRAVAGWAAAEGFPMAVHIAESLPEEQLLRGATGPFAENWRRRGIPLPEPPGASPVEWLDRWGVLSRRTLCIHSVRVDDSDIRRLVEAQCAVAHCPISNRRHGHGDAPLGALLAAGLRVGVGTDSVVSVDSLDLLAEARVAAQLGPLSPDRALELATLAAARALDLEDQIGSLVPGKWGDVAVFELPEGGGEGDIVARALQLSPGAARATFVAGKEVFRRVGWTGGSS
jgi:5-methylthioadenosine/S-adenosylhomocysteine deaminase